MGYKTWHNYGFGVCVTKLKINSPERVGKLIGLTKRFRKDVQEYFDECEITEPTMDDYKELDQDYYNGVAYVLQQVIDEKEHLELSVCDDFEGNRHLLYMPDYPWFTPWRYWFISEKKVERIIRKYLSMLTDDEFEVEYLSAENGG